MPIQTRSKKRKQRPYWNPAQEEPMPRRRRQQGRQTESQQLLGWLEGQQRVRIPVRTGLIVRERNLLRKPATCYKSRKEVVKLRFGPPGQEVFNAPFQASGKYIAAKVGLKLQTVYAICRRFKEQRSIPRQRIGGYEKGSNKLSPMKEWILKRSREWAILSIKKRVQLIKNQYSGLRLSPPTLMKFYKINNISFRSIAYKFRNKDTEADRREQQREFVVMLSREIELGSNVIYMDETSTNLWEHRVKTWQPKGRPFVHLLNSQRDKNITIIGGISTQPITCRNGQPWSLFYTVCEKTDKDTVHNFYVQLLKQIPMPRHRTTLVIDRHPAHTSPDNMQFLFKSGVNVLVLPPCSSTLNPVEQVWAQFKRHWSNELFLSQGQLKFRDIEARMREILDREVIPNLGRTAQGNQEAMRQVLRGELV